MSSTASNCGVWKEFIAAFIRQFPNEEEIPQEAYPCVDGALDVNPLHLRMDEALWGKPYFYYWTHHPLFLRSPEKYECVLAYFVSCIPGHRELPRDRAMWLVNNQAELKRIIREEILLTDACSLENDLGVIAVPEGYGHETYLRTFLRDHQGDFMFISPEFGRKGVPARVEPGKMIRVRLYRQPKGSRVGREGIARFLQRQKGNLFLGAHGLALICACTNWSGPNNAWTCSLDEVDGYSGDDALGVPAFGRFFPGGGWRLDVRSLDPTADAHASAHYIFGFSDAAVEQQGN